MGQPTRTDVRRKDRAVVDEAWIQELLERAAVGTLATVSDGEPFLHLNLFVFDRSVRVLYLHGAAEGRTNTNIRNEERVCFGVYEMGRLLPGDTANDMSVEYASVIVFGRARVVADPEEANRALEALLGKYFTHLQAGRDYRPIVADELARTAVYRIEIDEWSGKRKQVGADFPGAFYYGER
ncbi:MAG: pyridoxamine 5'-phosphate oxidase family protein [Chloroflexi bacterium]|nr:pyridoxamine 5'-phosphate oxidase family protein [Chloroflexota bacterium]